MAAETDSISYYDTDHAFRLRRDERVPEGVRRIARGQLEDAQARLSEGASRLLGEPVHETRKSIKRLRACVRLSRDAIGARTYRRESAVLRMAGQRLAVARDSQVLVDTLDELERRFADELPSSLTNGLRERLEAEREGALATLRDDERTIDAVLGEIESVRAHTEEWTFETDGFDALRPGLRRIYRRGRKRTRRARKVPSSENLHDLRKRVKDLWHATQILRPIAPKRIKKLSKRAHRLADLLGHDHDLALLGDYADVNRQAFVDEAARERLLSVVERRRSVLQRKALKRAKRLYRRSPKRFVGAIERDWRKRAPRRPKPITG